MKNINISFLILPYLLICGGLYHVAFWDTFGVNGLAYIGVSEIIKSSIYPFMTFGFTILFGMIYSEFVFGIDKVFPSGEGRNTSVGIKLNSRIGMSIGLILWLILILWASYERVWVLWGCIIAIVPSVFLDRLGLFQDTFGSNSIRQLVIRLLIYVPAFSFAAGKYEGQLIKENKRYQFLVNPKKISGVDVSIDTLKFIGNTGQQIFLTDMHNSVTIILRSENIDTLVLRVSK